MRGVVAAGHPLTAKAGAEVLRAGGNAVDAAVACVLMSFVAESALTGPGAGGFMLVHVPDRGTHLLDFFVAAPGMGLDDPEPAALMPIDVKFSEDAIQRFNVGPSSCGAYGTPLGLAQALERFGGGASLAELTAPAARAARDGVEVLPMQAFLFTVLEPILRSSSGVRRALRARRPPARRGRHHPAARARRPARAARGGGTRLPLHGRRRGARERLGARARRAPDA